MKKKSMYIFISCIAICVIALTLILTQHFTNQHIVLSAKTDSYNSLEELENASPIIVLGKKINERDSSFIYDEYNYPIMMYTLSNFQISQIYKDDTNSLSTGENIPIIENEAIDNDGTVYHIANYTKMENNNEYILFLHYSDSDNWYVPTGVNFGKVPLDAAEALIYQDNTNRTRLSQDEFELIRNISTQVREKYLEKDLYE